MKIGLHIQELFKNLRFHAILTITIFIIYLLIIFSIKTKASDDVPLLMMIFLAGSAGGLVNSYLRIKNIPLSQQMDCSPHLNFLAILQLYLTPFISGFLAFVFYGICITGLIGGEVLPKFVGLEAEYISVADIFQNVQPSSRIDAIKAVMWGFITGFSERLVPNVIDKIVTDLKNKG